MNSQLAQAKLARAAADILAGRVGIIGGARAVLELRFAEHGLPDNAFGPFAAFDSETDHLPDGAVRGLWDAAQLERADAERDLAEAHYRSKIEAACRSLLIAMARVSV